MAHSALSPGATVDIGRPLDGYRGAVSSRWAVASGLAVGLLICVALVLFAFTRESLPTPESLGCVSTPASSIDGVSTPETCADSTLRPTPNGFSFPNWSGMASADAIGVPTLIRLFGRDRVCAKDSGDACIPAPEAVQWLKEMNEIIRNGRCEGMSVEAERLFTGLATVATLDSGSQTAADLSRSNSALISDINYWWLTQVTPEVAAAAEASRRLTPAQILSAVVHGLRDNSSNTMGIYSASAAHAVTPFAVTYDAPLYTIWVYDSNSPGRAGRILIDVDAQRWRYLAPGATTDDGWQGVGAGGLEYTPMHVRLQDFTAPFSDDPAENAYFLTIVASSTSPAATADLIVRTGTDTFDSRDTNDLPDGVVFTEVNDSPPGYSTMGYIKDATTVTLTPVTSDPSAPLHVVLDGPRLRWQKMTAHGSSTDLGPLAIHVSRDGAVDYAVPSSTRIDVASIDESGELVTTTVTGPRTYHLPGNPVG